MIAPDPGFAQVELATGNDIVAYYVRATDEAVVFALLPEADNTVRAAITLAKTTVDRAESLIEAFKELETNR